jgi:hypothetical protein
VLTNFWPVSLKEKNHRETVDVEARTVVKYILKIYDARCGLNLSGSGYGPVAGLREHGCKLFLEIY